MFSNVFGSFPKEFAHLRFRVRDDMLEARCVLSISSKLPSIIDDVGSVSIIDDVGSVALGGRSG